MIKLRAISGKTHFNLNEDEITKISMADAYKKIGETKFLLSKNPYVILYRHQKTLTKEFKKRRFKSKKSNSFKYSNKIMFKKEIR